MIRTHILKVLWPCNFHFMKYSLLFCLFLVGMLSSFSQQPTTDTNGFNEIENDSTLVSFAIIENVPVYPGCNQKLENEKLKQCMSDKVSALIADNFDVNVAYRAHIPYGLIRINVAYIINKNGDIENIMARSAYNELEAEAIRVVKLIPRMKPGYQNGKPVAVPYSIPILINVEDRGDSNKKIPLYNGCNENLGYELLKQCTIEKIMDFVKLNIDMEAAGKLFPLDKSTQFQANFVIDKKGVIKDIKVKAHKRELAALAIRTLKRLPKMKLPKAGKEKLSDAPFEFLMTLYFD